MLNFEIILFLILLLINNFFDDLFLLKLGCYVLVRDDLSLSTHEIFESWIIDFPVETQLLLLVFITKEGVEILEVAAILGLIK